jgi:hypothetical protein
VPECGHRPGHWDRSRQGYFQDLNPALHQGEPEQLEPIAGFKSGAPITFIRLISFSLNVNEIGRTIAIFKLLSRRKALGGQHRQVSRVKAPNLTKYLGLVPALEGIHCREVVWASNGFGFTLCVPFGKVLGF